MSVISFIRGAMLPFFFITGVISAESSLDSYYSVFYSDINDYGKWVSSERNDYFKDIFIAAYNLPSSRKRKFNYNLNIRNMKSYSTDKRYGYLYIEVKGRTGFEIAVSGIRKGEISINGSKRGDISVEKDSGYALIKGTFERGVYFISFKIVEKFEHIPIIVLSNRNLQWSDKKGFNRNSSASVRIINYNGKNIAGVYSDMYKSFCFPHTGDAAKRDYYFSVLKKKNNGSTSENILIDLLSRPSKDKTAAQILKETGFTEHHIEWWQDSFFKKEMCRYE